VTDSQRVAETCCSAPPYFIPANKTYLSASACRLLSTTIYICRTISITLLLTVCCVSWLVEALCLICRVRCTHRLPPTVGVVYVFLIPTWPKICVCFIYSMALVASCGVLRTVQSMCQPDGLAKMRFQMSSCHLPRRRSWTTVCRLWPHSQCELVTPGTLRSKSKSLSPMFSMHDCTSSALSRSVEALVALDHLCGGCSRVCMLLDPCPRSSVCLSVPSLSVVCTIV
jgi:hypothetical protein